MKRIYLSLTLSGLFLAALFTRAGLSAQKDPAPLKPKLALAIKPQHVADALRAVVSSDREVYTQCVEDNEKSAKMARAIGEKLPSPCEMLRLGSQAVASKGVEFSYVLRSLRPINPRNHPETEVETKGLQFIATRPDLIYTSEELLGGRWYFTAVYPDVARNQSCVTCHNQHRRDSASELKLGEVFGGLIVRIALEL